jgi:hypothetical protein
MRQKVAGVFRAAGEGGMSIRQCQKAVRARQGDVIQALPDLEALDEAQRLSKGKGYRWAGEA